MRDRIQKVLAAQGIASRRQVEAWIAEGRVSVNGKPAQPGQPVGERDDVRLDGRKLRLSATEDQQHQGLIYHRPPQESVRGSADSERRASMSRLPRVRGLRWIPISPLAASDGGLEVFVTDGQLAAALTRKTVSLPEEYSVRVRGEFHEDSVAAVLQAAIDDLEAQGTIEEMTAAGGEGVNRWVHVASHGLRPRDFKRIFERCGLEANRILRTRVGPITMDRALARGRHRRMTDGELRELGNLVERPATGSRKRRR